MTAFLKRFVESANCRWKGIVAESRMIGLKEKHGTVKYVSMTQTARTILVNKYGLTLSVQNIWVLPFRKKKKAHSLYAVRKSRWQPGFR